MYDYKALRKVITMLGVAFVVVLAVLLLTSRPLSLFALISGLFMLAIAGYFITIPLRLIREMQDMERMIEGYKQAAKKQQTSDAKKENN
ncbi:MAG: hypothetical protein II358_01340 [Tidjanibacter sp.]|jgi:ABC-type transport system involved in cytochrome bd biosynthesis fused ATPase/permease subunit|nr:hypothetical protein [Tidjanibacter sp.]